MWQEGTDLRMERSKWSLGFYYVGIILTIVALLISIFHGGFETKYLISDGFLIYSLIRFYRSYPDCPRITIGQYGIEVEGYLLLSWDLIDNVLYKKEGIGKNRKKILVIQFHNANGETQEAEFYLNSYSYNSNDIRKAIHYWSGR